MSLDPTAATWVPAKDYLIKEEELGKAIMGKHRDELEMVLRVLRDVVHQTNDRHHVVVTWAAIHVARGFW